ncbi:hypothetical protein K438DRAFT_2077706 [Mycena galopus ATCC 62051]|nr:hypothetical protein K438DRAFT_2077706 [Mycena galopus ATCC 62051]
MDPPPIAAVHPAKRPPYALSAPHLQPLRQLIPDTVSSIYPVSPWPMCGLISAFYLDGEVLKLGLDASLETIKHRGPDSRGLGHVRLSIIDLPTGQQPLSDEENSIYCVKCKSQGYSFKTKSDSELVVQLYKRDVANLLFHLRGEFAFALYDANRPLLLAARDRFGIKPLYYTVPNGCILFGSEMKAFMGPGWQAEWDIESIVNNADFADERTFFKGVKKSLGGHGNPPVLRSLLSASLDGAFHLSRLHDFNRTRSPRRGVAGIATQLLREKDHNAKLTAFTLAFVEDEITDESPLAARTAARLGADLLKVDTTEAKLVALLEESVWHSEMVNHSFHGARKLLLSQAVRDAGYKVALSGEGADEIFGGYPLFYLDYLRNPDPAAAELGISLPSEVERDIMAEDTRQGQHKSAGPRPLLNITAHLALERLHNPNSTIFRSELADLVKRACMSHCIEEVIDIWVRKNSFSGAWHSLHVSLNPTDKAHSRSLKIRPLPGAEPGQWTLTEKWILRQAMKPFVTDEVYMRKKVSFNPPPAGAPALASDLVPLQIHLKTRITRASVERLGFISWPVVEKLFGDYLDKPEFPVQGTLATNIDARALISSCRSAFTSRRTDMQFEYDVQEAPPRSNLTSPKGTSFLSLNLYFHL